MTKETTRKILASFCPRCGWEMPEEQAQREWKDGVWSRSAACDKIGPDGRHCGGLCNAWHKVCNLDNDQLLYWQAVVTSANGRGPFRFIPKKKGKAA